MFQLLPETPDDIQEVEYLYDLAFAPGRAALSSYRLREGVAPVAGLSLVARDELGVLAGAVRYWPVRIGAAAALLLGPIAVHPTRQGEGLGAVLISESLAAARGLGWSRVLLVGDEPYYSRFGFTRAVAAALDYPPPTNPDRLLGRELEAGAFEGVSGIVRGWEQNVAN
jgi:predicted N-acetyltransferase YhbS